MITDEPENWFWYNFSQGEENVEDKIILWNGGGASNEFSLL